MRVPALVFALAFGVLLGSDAAFGQDSAVATPGNPPAPLSDDQVATDADIQQDMQAMFDRVPGFEEIEVNVEAGVVRLEGEVADPSAIDEAEQLARTFDGVLVVLNRIQATTSLSRRLQPTLERLNDFFLDAAARAPLFATAILIVLIAYVLGRLARRIRLPASIATRNTFLQGLAQRFLQAFILLSGIVVALQLLDAVAIFGALAGTAGLAGLTLGFAFKDIIENYLAGILLSLRHPFAQTDHIVADGNEGKVVRLTWRDTILMTLDGNHLRMPNAKVFGSTILNYTRNPKRRFAFDFGVGPAADLDEARRVGIATLESMQSVLRDPPPEALAMELGDSSVQMRFLAWVDQREHGLGKVRSEAIRLVKLALEDSGVDLPSPEFKVVLQERLSDEAQPSELPTDSGGPTRPRGPRQERDTASEDAVDEQIREDQRISGEENLLVGTSGPDLGDE